MSNAIQTTQTSPKGFFTLAKRGGRWILLTPERTPFFSVGLNHIDSSPLRYPENLPRWEQKYGNNSCRWIRESVSPNLKAWGFNTAGWVQDVTIKHHAHTPSFSLEEYRALSLPYCHLLPFIETHQWNKWHKNPDIFSKDFEDWCDYVARSQCTSLKDEPNLIAIFTRTARPGFTSGRPMHGAAPCLTPTGYHQKPGDPNFSRWQRATTGSPTTRFAATIPTT